MKPKRKPIPAWLIEDPLWKADPDGDYDACEIRLDKRGMTTAMKDRAGDRKHRTATRCWLVFEIPK